MKTNAGRYQNGRYQRPIKPFEVFAIALLLAGVLLGTAAWMRQRDNRPKPAPRVEAVMLETSATSTPHDGVYLAEGNLHATFASPRASKVSASTHNDN